MSVQTQKYFNVTARINKYNPRTKTGLKNGSITCYTKTGSITNIYTNVTNDNHFVFDIRSGKDVRSVPKYTDIDSHVVTVVSVNNYKSSRNSKYGIGNVNDRFVTIRNGIKLCDFSFSEFNKDIMMNIRLFNKKGTTGIETDIKIKHNKTTQYTINLDYIDGLVELIESQGGTIEETVNEDEDDEAA